MSKVNFGDVKDLADHYESNLDDIKESLETFGVDTDNTRTIGAYIGVTGDSDGP